MNPIIEKVAKAIIDLGGCIKYENLAPDSVLKGAYDKQAAVAIRATLEHYMENVSDGLGVAGGLKLENVMFEGGDEECTGVIFNDVKPVFKAMLAQALHELDA